MKKIPTLLLGVAISVFCHAQSYSFMHIPKGAKSASMGGIEATEPSPKNMEAFVNYGCWAPKLSDIQFLSGELSGVVKEHYYIGGETKILKFKPYTFANEEGMEMGQFTPTSSYSVIKFAYIHKGLTVGANAVFINRKLQSVKDKGVVGFDIVSKYSFKKFTFTIAGKNFACKDVPIDIEAGAKARLGKLDLAFQGNYLPGEGIMAGAGLEYSPIKALSLRAGYHYGPQNILPSYASAGIGFHFLIFELSGAYVINSGNAGNTFLISFGFDI